MKYRIKKSLFDGTWESGTVVLGVFTTHSAYGRTLMEEVPVGGRLGGSEAKVLVIQGDQCIVGSSLNDARITGKHYRFKREFMGTLFEATSNDSSFGPDIQVPGCSVAAGLACGTLIFEKVPEIVIGSRVKSCESSIWTVIGIDAVKREAWAAREDGARGIFDMNQLTLCE